MKSHGQASIRSFFQPRQPSYAAPPSAPAPLPQGSSQFPSKTTTVTQIVQQQGEAPVAPPLPPQTAHASVAPVIIPAIPVLPSPPSLPSQASIVPVAEHHLPALRRINALLLPVPYPDTFYARVLDPAASGLFSRVILWQDAGAAEPKVIGGLVCQLEPSPFVDAHGNPRSLTARQQTPPPQSSSNVDLQVINSAYHAIYIQSLALLSPYRSLGLAAAALEHIVASAAVLKQIANPPAPPSINVATVYAHVWTDNEAGLRWYGARGFVQEGTEPVKGYYFKLKPDTAWVVRREIGVGTALGLPAVGSTKALSIASPPTQPSIVAKAANLPSRPPLRAGPSSNTAPSPGLSASSGLSFQHTRPDMEWNDMPPDMLSGPPPLSRSASNHLSPPPSAASSRSSSASGLARKKRDRAYPAAAFGT